MKEEIIRELSLKYHIPIIEVRKIVDSQFDLVYNVIKEGKFDSVRLPYFGKFRPITRRLKKFGRIKDDKDI